MLSRKLLLPLVVAGMLGLVFARPSAQGTIPNQPVYFTFSAPVSLPGVTLPAGEYEFKLANSLSNRHIVQVFNRADAKIVATIMAIPAIRNDVPEKPEVRFLETPSNMAPAVQTWWYPGITTGHEFIYPREQAQVLAKLNAKGVLTTKGDEKTGDVTRLTAGGEANAAAPPSPAPAVSAPEPTRPPAPMPSMTAQTARNLQADTTPTRERHALPQTAGELPTLGAVGLISLFAGLALATRRRPA